MTNCVANQPAVGSPRSAARATGKNRLAGAAVAGTVQGDIERAVMTERLDRANVSPSLRSGIASFVAMDFMREAGALAAAGRDIVRMEVGQPGTPAPRLVREAAAAAMVAGPMGYTDALGLPALRERVARHYREAHGLDIAASRVVITTGSSAGFILAFLALLDAGEGVALPAPGYPCYRQIARVLGLKPVYLPASASTRFAPRPGDLQAAFASDEVFNDWKTASPVSFPVGRVTEKSEKSKWASSVTALPWLILADASHRVVAEGFSLDELDAQVQKLK